MKHIYKAISLFLLFPFGLLQAQNWTTIALTCGTIFNMKKDPQNNFMYVMGELCGMNQNGLINGIAKYDGVNFIAMDNGITDYDVIVSVTDLEFYNNTIYICGEFDSAGYSPVNSISRYVNNQWTTVAGGANDFVSDMCVYNGDLYAAGRFTQIGTVTTTGLAK
jgi:hypothetical protein